MELTNQFVTAETNKSAEIVVKLLENLLGRGHTVWMDNFYNSPDSAQFLKSKENRLLELYVLTGKMSLLFEE
jgi:hypothetical protein